MATSSRIALILRSTRELSEPIHVHGASRASLALLTARYAYETPEVTVVLCADDDAAAEFASDLETLCALVDRNPVRVAHFPTWEQSPYSPIAPSLRTRLARVSVLSSLASSDSSAQPRVIVTSLAALCQATLS